MRKLFVALLLVLGVAALAMPAFAEFGGGGGDTPGMLKNAQIAQEMKSRALRLGTSTGGPDTVWVGFRSDNPGGNYWSIYTGNRRPRGTFGPGKGDIPAVPPADQGYWDWETAVHGDTLQGWWPMRHMYTSFFVASQPDDQRPWHAIDIGNSISYVINQGPGYRRTYGVTSAWHEDPGVNDKGPIKVGDVNPNPPRWSPIGGSMSAWCGLRAHGDLTQIDALTGNPYNADALEEIHQASPTIQTGPGGTNYHFPGYASQWDQMLYRDVDISGANPAAQVAVTFSYRTRMSTGKTTSATNRTGWFDKDPLAVVAGNFISSTAAGDGAPIDSFMVYVGCPVADTVGAEWTGSDGLTHQVFDPVRRWFGELIRANEAGGHYELLSTYGDDPPINSPADSNAVSTVTVGYKGGLTYGDLQGTWGNKLRLVFRVKTNRSWGAITETASADDAGSLAAGSYRSGYLGAAQVDDVSIDLGSGPVGLGGFDSKGDIDNSSKASALDFWKTSSKPPAIYHHIHDLSDLIYQDLCGPAGAVNRICNLAGNVISQGDHDLGEAFNGPFGTAEQEHFQGITSPTINLAFDPGGAGDKDGPKNNMGLDEDGAVPTANFGVGYEMYTGGYDLFSLGSGWQVYAKYYPATQLDGTKTWSTHRHGRFQFFNPDKQCFTDFWNLSEFGQVPGLASDPGALPDSVRVGLRKITQCYRFGITTDCGTTLGGYQDNVSFAIVDGAVQEMSVLIWELWQDTFPANETAGLPGTAEFDTTTALIGGGLNQAPLTGNLLRYDVPGDTISVEASGDNVEVQLKFRIWPGPGNYVVKGDPCSGLRAYPTDTTRISPIDGTFWSEYILNPGKNKGDMPTTGPCKEGGTLRHDQRWSELVWCNARMDTGEVNLFPIEERGLNTPLIAGSWATMYHEDDKHLAVLQIPRHKCFLEDPAGQVNMTNITCNSVPAWVTAGGPPYASGYDGNAYTVEGTKIIPDGILTPGSHVQYFFLKKRDGVPIAMVPDTGIVFPQNLESSFDAHRWQQFSVLPDAWKFTAYGGLGKACMLYVDWNDRNGTERVWVAVADSIGATSAARRGAHNGWTAPSKVDINDPAYFVDKNCQPGTNWDMYGVKAAESLNSQTGSIGARLAYRGAGTLLTDKWAKNAPTPEMMRKYYPVMMILTGGLNTFALTGPFNDRSQDDTEFIRQHVVAGTSDEHHGLFCQGDAYVEDLDANGNTIVAGLLNVSLVEASYLRFSGNAKACIDLLPTSVITTNGDIYGIRNTCLQTLDVLNNEGDAVPASYYEDYGSSGPYVASVFTDVGTGGNPDNQWQALIDGWDTFNLRSRLCDKTYGRLAYFWNVFTNVFGKICSVAGTGPQTTEVPNNAEGRTFVEFAGQNPLRQGNAVIRFALTKDDRVTAKIYDVSGRLVRTLADGQFFKAGDYTGARALQWDGLDNSSRQVARGVYFVHVKLHNSLIDQSRKMIVLK